MRTADLSRYRYHTGLPLRPAPAVDAPLFRDLGLDATLLFLQGRLARLAGPLSPILYTRTADYVEPYTDYGRIGRLVFLQPQALGPWQAGTGPIYIADARCRPPAHSIAFVPGDFALQDVAARAWGASSREMVREALGGKDYDAALQDTQARVVQLIAQQAQAERLLRPLRRALKQAQTQGAAQERMQALSLTEGDLCTAWNHISEQRRAHIGEVLCAMG